MCGDIAIEPAPSSEPLPIARRVKSYFIARHKFSEPGNLVPMSREVTWRNGMAVSGCGFGKKIEESGLSFPPATFGH